ncbi:hypothetical protein LLH06_00920 [Mucilaginibacter daejeonensis]|uniref:DUF5672 family protein n=1 Tax=Mucilaginibacter daejeonensis TaxID=398049 RepID=UPI001D17C4E0|nr:DUF5672 family protein [Mucilaginibacter daejeonensis]UEG53538.1 hypothetical protein LLH06_00920 [Mucilaginibacter daejeonensis]
MSSVPKKVVVIVPFYKPGLTGYEQIALDQCSKILGSHTIVAIKPHWLTLPPEAAKLKLAATESFDDSYFTSIAGYNRLMLAEEFYARFLEYEYMLIYQLDAFVFKDELLHWCDQGYDYIGAPWLRYIGHVDVVKAIKSNFKYYYHTKYDVKIDGVPSNMQFENKVGNGGLSLRRVQKFHHVTRTRQDDIQRYLSEENKHQYNEDAFWSVEVNRKKKYLNIPDHRVAVGFAFEQAPTRALELNNGQLPFGCHAWDKYLEFWRPYLVQQGYPQMDYQAIVNFKAELPVKIHFMYRISDAGNPKAKLSVASKMYCLDNFLRHFEHNICVYADNCTPETLAAIRERGIEPVELSLGNSNSWRYIVKAAIRHFDPNSFVYLIEDDYLHLPGSLNALIEALKIADYVTLYDHPDKYSDEQGQSANPHVTHGGEISRVLRTKSTHWKTTNSTTMTFAARVGTLEQDQEVWWRYTRDRLPDDFNAFQTLLDPNFNRVNGKPKKGEVMAPQLRTLISPIPALSTHAELAHLAPLTQWHGFDDWEKA